MNILIRTTVIYIVFFLYTVCAHAAGQPGIIESTHRTHDVSVKTVAPGDDAFPEAGQGNVLKIIRKEQGLSVEVVPDKELISKEKPPTKIPAEKKRLKKPVKRKPGLSPEEKHKRMLAQAWKKYEGADYPDAVDAFARVANRTRDPGLQSNAYLGIGYSLKQIGNIADARTVFELLVKRDYMTVETAPVLMDLLVSLQDWAAAGLYLERLPESQRTVWTVKVEEGRFKEEYQSILEDKDIKKLSALLKNNQDILARCALQDTFIAAAGEMADGGETDPAIGIYETLLQCREDDWRFRLHVHHEMEKHLPMETSLSSVKEEMSKGTLSNEYRAMLSELHIRLLKNKFFQADSNTSAYLDAGKEILDIEPDNEDVRSSIAWNCFNAKDYHCAEKHFMVLYTKHPENIDHLKGTLYSLINMGNREKALAILNQAATTSSDDMSALKHDLYYQIGESLHKDKLYKQAAFPLSKAVEIDPGDPDAVTLLAWTYYHQKNYSGALDLFKDAYRIDRSPESAEHIIMVLEKLDQDERAKSISVLSEAEEPLLRKTAADWYNDRYGPITASQIYNEKETCYYNCASPVLEASAYFRDKSGDAGLSKLRELSFPLRFHYPVRKGREWVFSLIPIRLDSGSAPDNPYAGSYFRYINDSGLQQRDMTDSVTVYEPEIIYREEGPLAKEFMIGTTPLNGAADPMPRFSARVSKKDKWYVKALQESVRESILSYIGLEDPYGSGDWGRVLKTGAGAGMTYPVSGPYWSSFNAEFDYYWGENVADNYSVSGTVSAGRTDNIFEGESNAGVFLTLRHFNKNSSFFTYGHGGYFSPDFFSLMGPFVRYTKKRCCDFWFDGEISAGYLYYRSADAPHYHKVTDDTSALSSASRADLDGEYSGEKESGVGLNIKLRAMKLVQERFAVGGYLQENTSSDFNEFRLGLLLHYYFEPMNKLCHTWDIFHRAED